MRTGRPERLRGFDYVGFHRYFLTFCTFERRSYFTDASAIQLVHAQNTRACRETHFALLAYCFMPDHVHLLVEATREDAACRTFIARAKQYGGFYFNREVHQPLWQQYGYERVLRSDEATLSVARYILENPVRGKLVKTAQEYPFLGSECYSVDDILAAVRMDTRWYRRQ